jgi:malate dehydrogenase (quinone)
MIDKRWEVEVKNLEADQDEIAIADFAFTGAGRAAIPLLEKTRSTSR